MTGIETSSGGRQNAQLLCIVKRNIDAVRPGSDLNQLEFDLNAAGNIIGLRSDDPAFQEWLRQTIFISQPEAIHSHVTYPNVFIDRIGHNVNSMS